MRSSAAFSSFSALPNFSLYSSSFGRSGLVTGAEALVSVFASAIVCDISNSGVAVGGEDDAVRCIYACSPLGHVQCVGEWWRWMRSWKKNPEIKST